MKEKIRVSTGKIREKGSEWEETVRQAEADMQNAREEMGQMDKVFHCEAVSQLRRAFDQLAGEGEQRIRELSFHVEKLQEIAGNYEEAEKENELVTADD